MSKCNEQPNLTRSAAVLLTQLNCNEAEVGSYGVTPDIHPTALCIRQTLVFGRRDRQTQTAHADADVRIADSDFEISKVLKSF